MEHRPGLLTMASGQVLDKIVAHLPVEDRVRLLSTCRSLASLARTSDKLWADVGLTLESPQQVALVARWLHGVRHQLGSLSISSPCSETAFTGQVLLLVGQLAGGSVHTLELDWRGCAELSGSWLAALPKLASLEVSARSIHVDPDLSSLPALTRLSLWPRDHLAMRSACLPPHLACLEVGKLQAGAEPLASRPLPPLADLSLGFQVRPKLDAGARDASLANLPALAATLTSLKLSDAGLSSLPCALGALTNLRRLDLCLAADLGAAGAAGLAPLCALRQLTFLDLAECGLQRLPAGVVGLPCLQELDLDCNPALHHPLPLAEGATNLRRLTLGVQHAARSAGQLPLLRALTSLCLTAAVDEGPSPAEVEVLLRSLARAPALQVLELRNLKPCLFAGSWGVLAAFAELMQRQPALQLMPDC